MEEMIELLKRLKVVDPEIIKQLEEIDDIILWRYGEDPINDFVFDSLLQGVLQRAIAARGWDLSQYAKNEMRELVPTSKIEFWVIINRGNGAYGNSPASALLSAYLAAVEG